MSVIILSDIALSVIMPNDIVQSVIMLSVIMPNDIVQSVIMLTVIMPYVVAPLKMRGKQDKSFSA
jgi:hypothetical protein